MNTTTNRVTITDFDMKFTSMVGFMVKWAIAAIPAALILLVIAFLASSVIAVLVASFSMPH